MLLSMILSYMWSWISWLIYFLECLAGESSRKGFYLYDDKRKASPDPEMNKYIEKSRSMASIVQDPKVLSYFLYPKKSVT